MINKLITSLFCLICTFNVSSAQDVITIDNYSVNGFGQVQLSIEGQEGKYYVLHAQHSSTFNWATSMTIGVSGTMVVTESSQA